MPLIAFDAGSETGYHGEIAAPGRLARYLAVANEVRNSHLVHEAQLGAAEVLRAPVAASGDQTKR